jgi:hypothetical protein
VLASDSEAEAEAEAEAECCVDVGRTAEVVSKYDRSLADQMRRATASVALNASKRAG